MSDPARTHVDNGLPFGSQQLMIGSATFIADNIDFDRPTTILTGTNEFGVPYREVIIEGAWTGSANLQMPTLTTPPPLIGAAVPLKEAGGAALTGKISKVGARFKKDGEIMLPIEFREKFGA